MLHRPLSPIRFHILLALSASSAHARLIARRIEYDSFGELEPSPATLHDNIACLVRQGLLLPGLAHNYHLTASGRERLENDLYRWRIVTSRASTSLRRV